MSADNYLFVTRRGKTGKYVGVMGFASNDRAPSAFSKFPVFEEDTLEAAMLCAHRAVQEEYYEYGVSVDPRLLTQDTGTVAS